MPLSRPLQKSYLEQRNAPHPPKQGNHAVGELAFDLAFGQQTVKRRAAKRLELPWILPRQQYVSSSQPMLQRIQTAARFSGVRPRAGAPEGVALVGADLSMAGHDRAQSFG